MFFGITRSVLLVFCIVSKDANRYISVPAVFLLESVLSFKLGYLRFYIHVKLLNYYYCFCWMSKEFFPLQRTDCVVTRRRVLGYFHLRLRGLGWTGVFRSSKLLSLLDDWSYDSFVDCCTPVLPWAGGMDWGGGVVGGASMVYGFLYHVVSSCCADIACWMYLFIIQC
jgi:hypothetical protein